jgi:hypothetical protein
LKRFGIIVVAVVVALLAAVVVATDADTVSLLGWSSSELREPERLPRDVTLFFRCRLCFFFFGSSIGLFE